MLRDERRRASEDPIAAQLRARYPRYGAKTIAALGKLDFGTVNNELIAQLVAWLLASPAREARNLCLQGHWGPLTAEQTGHATCRNPRAQRGHAMCR